MNYNNKQKLNIHLLIIFLLKKLETVTLIINLLIHTLLPSPSQLQHLHHLQKNYRNLTPSILYLDIYCCSFCWELFHDSISILLKNLVHGDSVF